MKKYYAFIFIIFNILSCSNMKNLSETELIRIEQTPYYTDGENVYLHLSNKYNNSGLLVAKSSPSTLIINPPQSEKGKLATDYEMFNGSESSVDKMEYDDYIRIYNTLDYPFKSIGFMSIAVRINNIKAADFKYLDGVYFTGKGKVFYNLNELEGADIKTFKTISAEYAFDKNTVYHLGKAIDNSDPITFKIIYDENKNQTNLAKDKNHVYNWGKILENANPQTFEIINHGYYKDDKHVWAYGYPLPDVCSNTFERIKHQGSQNDRRGYTSYSTDGKNIYFQSDKLEDADPQTFRVEESGAPNQSYGIDKNNIYYSGKKLEGVDVKSFKVIKTKKENFNWDAYDDNYYYNREQKTPINKK